MRTRAWETAPQKALRNCFKEGGKDSIYVILVKGEYIQSSTFIFLENFCWSYEASASHEKQLSTMKDLSAFLEMRRYKNWAHKIIS